MRASRANRPRRGPGPDPIPTRPGCSAVAQDRLQLRDDGRIVLTLKSAWADGPQQLVFEPLELLEKLAALNSAAADQSGALPRRCSRRMPAGARARGGLWRPADESARGRERCSRDGREPTPAPALRHWAWADLMRRAFDIDVLACPRCGGRVRLIAVVENPDAIRAILAALAESEQLGGRAPLGAALNARQAEATGA